MGTVHVNVKIRAIRGRKTASALALVDTGASLTVLPRSLAEKIGLFEGESVPVRVAGGGVKRMNVASAFIRVDGREAPCTVLVAPSGDVLLGAETLELLGATVDPKRRRLRLAPHHALLAMKGRA